MRPKESAQEPRPTLSELMRQRFKFILDPIAGFLNRLGLYPNTLTLIGLGGHVVAAIFLGWGEFFIGGLIALIMGPIDALDGAMARLRGEASDFGAFVDSVTDRYAELLLLGGLQVHYLITGELLFAGFVFAAAAGSVLVSYVKARAEGLGFQAKGGILTRLERYFVLAPSMVLGYPHIGVIIVAVLANVTALQRIYMVRRQARRG
jgi:CDP-diacylglycerol--glycerol-3-phosphate 3-phosphatidyltransferase